jgi:uncharacterized SAM-binding protein YcdF (DUF218 family)
MMNGVQASILCRSVFEYALNPMCWFFLILLGLVIYCLWPGKPRASKCLGCVLLLFWIVFYGVSTPWLPNWMIARLEQQFTRITEVDKRVQWVVVLGAGVTESLVIPASDALNGVGLKRLLEGVRLYQKLPNARLILSGASQSEKLEYAEATRFAELTDWLGVPKAHRVLEAHSMNTADQARLIQSMVGSEPFYLVTSSLHMPRSMRLFQKQGMQPIAAPCHALVVKAEVVDHRLQFLPTAFNLIRFNIAWHEYLGWVWGRMRSLI